MLSDQFQCGKYKTQVFGGHGYVVIEYLMIFHKDFTSRLNDVDSIYNLIISLVADENFVNDNQKITCTSNLSTRSVQLS